MKYLFQWKCNLNWFKTKMVNSLKIRQQSKSILYLWIRSELSNVPCATFFASLNYQKYYSTNCHCRQAVKTDIWDNWQPNKTNKPKRVIFWMFFHFSMSLVVALFACFSYWQKCVCTLVYLRNSLLELISF